MSDCPHGDKIGELEAEVGRLERWLDASLYHAEQGFRERDNLLRERDMEAQRIGCCSGRQLEARLRESSGFDILLGHIAGCPMGPECWTLCKDTRAALEGHGS